MIKFEYRCLAPESTEEFMLEQLRQLGDEGFLFVGIYKTQPPLADRAVYARPIQEEPN